ncbi:MAG TPA: histidinol-phosphate transaminase [Gemmataceae bacterium]|nr:histidinol-phosphate transaminase [Gemmataceae bacterium]
MPTLIDSLRPCIRAMAAYTPGEQPREGAFIKLNTNENPYPPSPRVFEALRAALTGDRLRKYPDPVGMHFRQTAGRVLGVDPDGILIGNGSDDILTILTRAFVPEGGLIVAPTPSYLLYHTLANLQGARFMTVPYAADWKFPCPWPIRFADLTFLANPNSPSGTTIPLPEIDRLRAANTDGPLVVDEAYADFAENNALELLKSGMKDIVITRSFSKSYSLAGIRFGFAVGDAALIQQLYKVKDSYNCDALSLIAAAAAIEDQDYFRTIRERILATRGRMEKTLTDLGFLVCPSQANFVWCRRSDRPVKPIYEELKKRNILVRYMNYDGYGDGLRISVGTDEEIDRLLAELTAIL